MSEAKESGVQELIDRLSQEGVAEGQRKADELVAQAEARASNIVESARTQANDIVRQARQEADQFKKSGESALQLACRDAVRDLQNQIHEGFRHNLQRLVAHSLNDTEFLKELILEIARKASPPEDAGPIEVLLPMQSVSDEDIRARLEEGDEDALVDLVRGMTGDGTREGFTLKTTDSDQAGIRVSVVDEDVEIELTENAISDLLGRHLLPRFALYSGVRNKPISVTDTPTVHAR